MEGEMVIKNKQRIDSLEYYIAEKVSIEKHHSPYEGVGAVPAFRSKGII